MIKHYIEKSYPSVLFCETILTEVKNRDFDEYNACRRDTPICVRFCDIEETHGSSGQVLKSEPFNYSQKYFFGKRYSLAEVKEYFPKQEILISNMVSNNYSYVVQTKSGQFFEVNENDIVIEVA